MGHDPAKTFNDRLIAQMAEQSAPKATTHKVLAAPPLDIAPLEESVDGDPPDS